MCFKISDISSTFICPIEYTETLTNIDNYIISDIQLTKINKIIFNPVSDIDNYISDKMSEYYTSDIVYLKDTQKLLEMNDALYPVKTNKIINDWSNLKNETSFYDKYLYLDMEMTKFLNRNEHFVQFMSMYNILSPILSLCLPIFILIVPFFVLMIRNIKISIDEYLNIFKLIIRNHSIGKLFMDFGSVNMGQKIYILISFGLYLFSIYQNFVICRRFYTNFEYVHEFIFKLKEFIKNTVYSMEKYLEFNPNSMAYLKFNECVIDNKDVLNQILNDLNKVNPFNITISKCGEIGHIMKSFYEIYDDEIYNKSILFAFGFTGYINNLHSIQSCLGKKLNMVTFSKSNKLKIKDMRYPAYLNIKSISNDIVLDRNIIVTGPNASGKTTILKSILINIILSQQYGCGYYKNMQLNPYDSLHCYLNIPDTMGRDSLFQAEARRCKNIIDEINKHVRKRHLCIFDELYSGTNPDEAIYSAISFLRYLNKNPNVYFALTTHYKQVPKYFMKHGNKTSSNHKMISDQNENFKINHTYKINKGISNIKGGYSVLKELKYPKSILEFIKNDILIQKNKNLK
tara:strand:+ start:2222 stop:3937 length:1716 start_codon:yes stop_codon:yes gene_type:complete